MRPDMPSDSAPKKKKKLPKGFQGPFKPGTTNPNTGETVRRAPAPSSSTPSYMQPPKKKVEPQAPNLLGLLSSINQDRIRANNLPDLAGPSAPARPQNPVPDLLSTVTGSDGSEEAQDRTELQNFLSNISDPKAPLGYNKPVPPKYRSDAWNKNQIASELSDATSDANRQYIMNDILERQFQDRENYMLGGGDTPGKDNRGKLYKRSDKIVDALERAEEGLQEGDFDVLRREMEGGLSLDLPSYRSEFGVTPEQIWEAWEKERENLTPEERKSGRYRVDMYRRHYRKLREGYQSTQKYVDDAIKRYEDKYNDRLDDFENWSGEDQDKNRAIAAKASKTAIPDLTPPTSKEDQEVMDQAGGNLPGLAGLMGGDETLKDVLKSKRQEAKAKFGVEKLPSIKDMLAVKVQEGNLDPDNEDEINEWVQRFKNPDHPETRAMYGAFARQFGNSQISDEDLLEYINEPVTKLNEYQAESDKRAKETEGRGLNAFDWIQRATPVVGSFLSLGDDEDRSGLERFSDIQLTRSGELKDVPGSGMSGLEWTIDKLARLSYGVAGFADAFYALNEESNEPWYNKALSFADPVSLLSGESWFNSLDDIIADPQRLADPFNAAYDQVFRGSGLPGVEDNIVPITFSQVIANNAARDPEDNIYDKSWYQHSAGFILDAGLDPLNFIGIGLVDDAIKIPARLVQATDKGEKATVLSSRLADRLQHLTKGPVAEQSFRMNEALREFGQEQFYTTDAGVFGGRTSIQSPVGTLSDTAVGARQADPFPRQLSELQVQINKSINDNAVDGLTESINRTVDPSGSLMSKTEDHLRVNRLSANIKNLGYDAVEGVKALASGQGFESPIDYITGGGKLPHEFESVTDFNRAANPVPVGDYPNAYVATRISDSLKSGYAKSMGYSVDEFPFSEQDIYRSLIEGPRLARKSDPLYAVRYNKTSQKIERSRADIQKHYKDGPEPNIEKYQNASISLRQSLDAIKTEIYGASLRYLDELGTLRNQGVLFSDRALARDLWNNLQTVRARNEQGAPGASNIKTLEEQPADDSSAFDIYSSVTDEELRDPSNPIYSGAISDFPEETHFEQLEKTLTRRINRLRLDKDGVLTGLPPREAYDVAQLIKQVPGLTNPNGSIRMDRIEGMFYFRDVDWVRKQGIDPQSERGRKMADLKWGYTAPSEEIKKHSQLWEMIRGALDGEYQDAYNLYRKELSEANKAAQGVEDVTPVGTQEAQFRRKYGDEPANSDPIVSSPGFKNSEWAKDHPEGFSSRQDLMEYALSSPENFYSALYSAGAPFKFKGPKRVKFAGEDPKFDQPALLRKWAMKQSNNARDEVDRYMKQVARVNYEHLVEKSNKIETVDTVTGEITSKVGSGVGTTELNRLFNDTWNATVKARKDDYAKRLHEAKLADSSETAKAKRAAEIKAGFKEDNYQNIIDLARVRRRARTDAKSVIMDSIKRYQKVPRTSANERMTINETARAARSEVQKEYRSQVTDIKGQILDATNASQVQELKGALAGLNTRRQQALRDIERARVEAHETKKILIRRYEEESILQVANMPTHMTTKAVQLRIMGMRKNFQTTNSLFNGMEMVEKLLPASVYQKFASNFVRPSKQLSAKEAITFRAMWESKTPVLIKAHLSRMSHRMGQVETANRVAMFDAARRGREYMGPQSEHFESVKAELDDIESIFQGKNPFYFYHNSNEKPVPLEYSEIAKFMKHGYGFSPSSLMRKQKETGEPISLDDVYQAIKEANPKSDINDPFRFAWVMRLAADQARQTKAIHHLINTTFGVKRSGSIKFVDGKKKFVVAPGDNKARVIERLKSKGWQTIKELDEDHYFPAESVQDIRKLLEFMNPKNDISGPMKQFDTILGYWKQGATIYNPGYYTRNGVGEIMASWLDGVNDPKYYRQAMRVIRYMKNTDVDLADLMEKWALKGEVAVNNSKANSELFKLKGGTSITVEDALRYYIDHGLKSTFANTDIGTGLRSVAASQLSDSAVRKTGRRVNEFIHDAGEGFEDWLRMAHFIHAMQRSGRTTAWSAAEYAAERVRKYHFDYTDFSKFEQSVMLRAFPFYKWTRRGAPLMLAHLALTPGKITAVPKAMDALSGLGFNPEAAAAGLGNAILPGDPFNNDDPILSSQDVHDDMNGYLPDYQGIAPAWVRDLFAYQMNPAPDDEYANYFRIQTPMIDGLNAALNPSEQALLPLLNPAIKMPIELGMNRSMDPDFPYEIYGGQFNENNQINPAEATIAYAARSLNPITGFLAKLSKNGDLPGESPLEFGTGGYRDEHGYDSRKDWASFLTGMGFYQGRPKDSPQVNDETTEDPTPVGTLGLDELPQVTRASGQKDSTDPSDELKEVEATINNLLQGGGFNGGSYSGSGWRNFGYGGRGYRRGYYSSGRQSGNQFNLLEFLQQLSRQIDQGQVYRGELDD